MKNQSKGNMVIATAAGILGALMITVIITVIGTFLIHGGRAGEGSNILFTTVSWILSAFAGCIIAGVLYRECCVMVSVITAAVYFAVLISMHILIFEGEFQNIILGLLLTAAGTGCSIWILCGRKKTKKRKYNYKKR